MSFYQADERHSDPAFGITFIAGRMPRLFGRKSKAHLKPPPFGAGYATPSTPSFVSYASGQSHDGGNQQTSTGAVNQYLPLRPRPDAVEYAIIDENEKRGEQLKLQNLMRQRQHNSTKERVKELRNMAREQRQLDIEIFSSRDVLENDRDYILTLCSKSDELHDRITAIVMGWEENYFEDREKEFIRAIKDGLSLANERYTSWRSLPPWHREETKEVQENGWDAVLDD